MLLIMEYGYFKPHEADTFELDHVIAYKQSSKINSRNTLMEVNLENFPLQKLPAIRYIHNIVNTLIMINREHWLFEQ